jgi:ParB family chromosome partitioning protein
MDPLRLIPLAEIDPHALLRDRTEAAAPASVWEDETGLGELVASIMAIGLRQPIEVWQLRTPAPPFRYGLIAGFRRFRAFESFRGTPREGEFAAIPAFVRTVETFPAAMAAMVAENEIRSDISPWEKGRLIAQSVREGHFDTLDAAVESLYPGPFRQKRARIRAFAEVVETLGGLLTRPETLTQRQMERIAAALRDGMTDLIVHALERLARRSPETQWEAMKPLLFESLALPDDATHATQGRPRTPRRMLYVPPGLTIRRELTRTGWALHFSGTEAKKGGLMEDVMDDIERWYLQR